MKTSRQAHHRQPVHRAGAPASPAAVDARFQDAFQAHKAGRIADAEAGYNAVLAALPDHPHALNNLAVLLKATRRFDEAAACYARAIARHPGEAHFHSNLGCLFADTDRAEAAAARLKRAIALRPDYTDALFNLGNCLRALGDRKGAMAAYQHALTVNPDMGEALANKGDLHKEQAELETAVDHFLKALRLRPDLAAPFNNLGEALKEQGRLEEAVSVLQQGLAKHPKEVPMHSNLLFALNYMPNVPADQVHRLHVGWGERHADPVVPAVPARPVDRSPDRRLRIGYVSPDFCTHSCAYFSEPLIRAHDRAAVEVVCYATSRRRDATTGRFQALADRWRSLVGMDEDAAAQIVRQDGIDILVDLAGHTGDNRLLLFARRPAPIQVTWLGYPNTTGLKQIDYRFTDAVADPPDAHDQWYTERLCRLPRGFLVFQPVISAEVNEVPPVLTSGHITFGSFNNISKVSPDVVRVWAEILRRVPTARLVLKGRQLGDAFTRDRYVRMFADAGVAAGRVELLPRIDPVTNHLRAYDRIDIGLDPFPYNGTTTTCEALWMGVPVVTRTGVGHVARVGASLLTQCGLTDLIADDEAGYIERAVALAADTARVADLRRNMRARLEKSSLTDYAGFARSVEAAYRTMWHDWLVRNP
ncbi:tetratricopeptide repeat protein [Azospirillum sp.]|uniref:O-linked N-acetylglucosamine transferase, SPINDLY family protein n=1 Tax=Azospirillum sp. TaxID=34012 RepID=UPI003D71E161